MRLTEDQHASLVAIAGDRGVIAPDGAAPYLTEWRKRWQGETPLILAPESTEQVSQIVRYCHENDLAITPQGGNTGLVGGQIPHGEILISLKRLRQVREVSPLNNTMTVEAGLTLAEAQEAAATAGRLFPLSIGAEGTCQIGGNISSNAGGVNVIRYGNMRDLVMGLEVVLPDGKIWHGLNALRKNNTGYDLKHLFIGAEGTLGLITAATLKLYPQPAEQLTAFAAIPSPQAAVDLLATLQEASGGLASSFELMSRFTLDLVLRHIPDMRDPLSASSPWYILMEFSAGRKTALRETLEAALAEALGTGLVTDATLAENTTQTDQFWALRHNASAGMAADPAPCAKCDVSVPIHKIPAFLEEADKAILAQTPDARIVAFGHIGDGNIHYDILGPENGSHADFKAQMAALEQHVHDVAVALGGSISAEHGIGVLKRDELRQRKSHVEMSMMDMIKRGLDPKGLMNPGKVL